MQQELNKVRITWKTAFAAALIVFILFGLGTKLVLSINMSLNSDMVGEGLEAMEIWKHQNYFLSGYYLPSQDTFLFTELLPFQLIPQILTGYDPMALKAVSFIIFALGILALACIVYLVSDSVLCALLFAALATNMPARGYTFLALPSSHGGALVFIGVIFAVLLYLGKNEQTQAADRIKKRKKTAASKIQWAYVIGLAILAAMTALSDTIMLTWLVVPYLLAYVLLFKNKTSTMNYAVAGITSLSVLAYVFKTYFVYTWVVQDVLTRQSTPAILSVNLPLYFKSLASLLNQGAFAMLDGLNGFGPLEALSAAAFIVLAAWALVNAARDKPKRFFYGVLLASGIVMFALYLISGYTIDASSARYLTFTALTVFMLVAVSHREGDRIYGAIALTLLLMSAIYGYTYTAGLGHQPNAEEYGLISYLKEKNLTFGYGTYWNSNIITYLSGEDVTVRAAFFYRDGLKPNVWLACERWYRSTPDRSFILVDNSTLDDNGKQVVGALTAKLNASEALHYGKYDIYPLENYHIAPFQVQRQ